MSINPTPNNFWAYLSNFSEYLTFRSSTPARTVQNEPVSPAPTHASSDETLYRRFWANPVVVPSAEFVSTSQTNSTPALNLNSSQTSFWQNSSRSAPPSPSLYGTEATQTWNSSTHFRQTTTSSSTASIFPLSLFDSPFLNFFQNESNQSPPNNSSPQVSDRFPLRNFLAPGSAYQSSFTGLDSSNNLYDNAYWNGENLAYGTDHQVFNLTSVAIRGTPEHRAYQAMTGNRSQENKKALLQTLDKIEKTTKAKPSTGKVVFENLDPILLSIIHVNKIDTTNLKELIDPAIWKKLLEIVDSENNTEKRFEKGKKLLSILVKIREYVKAELAKDQTEQLKTYMNFIEGYWNDAWKLIYYFSNEELDQDPITFNLLERPFSIPHDDKTRAVFNRSTIANLKHKNPFNRSKFKDEDIRFEEELQLWVKVEEPSQDSTVTSSFSKPQQTDRSTPMIR